MAAHLARFQSDDSLLGECDPWAGMEFFTPRGPGRAAYRPDGPLPKEFPRVGLVLPFRSHSSGSVPSVHTQKSKTCIYSKIEFFLDFSAVESSLPERERRRQAFT